MMKTFSTLSFVAVLLAVGVYLYLNKLRKYYLPRTVSNHPVRYYEELVPIEIAEALRQDMKNKGLLYTNAQDTKYYDPLYEDIGEAEPLKDGKCANMFKTPNKNRTKCVLPGRIDVGRHFILTGGPDALKENYQDMVSRLLSFGIYDFTVKDPAMEALFASKHFQEAAKNTCPPEAQFIDPFQFNYIVQIPGQTVAAHIDAPYFWGASRFQFPQWLLAVMVFSGLFEERFIPQIQIVGYIHEWEVDASAGGSFLYWGALNNETKSSSQSEHLPARMNTVIPKPRAGIAVDGSRLVHAANVYRPDVSPPKIDSQKTPKLIYDKNKDNWNLVIDDELIREYDMRELRISIVFRARCFADKWEAQKFREQLQDNSKALKLEEILEILGNDLLKRKRITTPALKMDREELAMTLIKEYIRYPFSSEAMIPLNYCAISRAFPWTEAFLQYICG